MFEGFARQWTPLLPARRVGAEPQRVRVAGEDLVVWRDEDRLPGVLLDRCPHRGVSLALGDRRPDGSIACAFHGWEFGTDGGCRYVPFNPDAPRERLSATALPVAEAGGYVWVFTGFDPDGGPDVPEGLSDPSLVRHDHIEVWESHWTRAMENMLDFPHLPYLHRSTIGRFVSRKQRRDSRLSFDLDDTPTGFRFGTRVDDAEPGAYLSWYRPHGMSLDTIPPPRMMRLHVWCVPVDAAHTRMFLTSLRNFADNPAASVAFNQFNLKVLHQDRPVVETSDPIEVPPGKRERSVPTDRPTLTFRTWYLRHLADSSVVDPRG